MATLAQLRADRDTARRKATELAATLRGATEAADAAIRAGDAAEADRRRQAVAALTAERQEVRESIAALAAQIDAARVALMPPDGADPIGALDAGLPVALLPVRLETRIKDGALLVRVYPDDLHVDSHEPELTADELAQGRDYWRQISDGAAQGDAWTAIARVHGPERADWVVGATRDGATPATRASSWTRAARAALLPDRWIVLGFAGDTRVLTAVGTLITDELVVGLSPEESGTPSASASTDALAAIDDDLRWLFEFDAAVEAGMGMRIPLPAAAQAGLTRLIVFGIKASMDEEETAAAAAGLVAAHRYTNGFAFLERGTPTNNTDDAPSGYSSAALPGAGAPFARPDAGAAADATARALGLPPSVFAHARNLDDPCDAVAAAMNAVLWPATWGYFLDHRVAGLMDAATIEQFRAHFVEHVRGEGPLSPFRIGREPYGVLPVTTLAGWAPADAGDVGLQPVQFLHSLAEPFRHALGKVPRLGASGDPDKDLLDVLSMDAVSAEYSVRFLVGPHYAGNFWGFMGSPLDHNWWREQAQRARPPVSIPGLPDNTPQATALFAPTSRRLGDKPLVDGGAGVAYLATIALQGFAALRDQADAPSPRPILYDLLRHALLVSYASEARRIQVGAGVTVQHPEPELIGIASDDSDTLWQQLGRPAAAVTGTDTLGDFLNKPGNSAALDEIRAAIGVLAPQPVAALELHVAATLDTASHRYDAWVTSLAARRLHTLRQGRPAGLRVGAYGWVENLAAGSATPSQGYVHAPSAVHATTAAILASGYLTHRQQADGNPFAIDLSSERVKRAMALVDGARHGQPVPALIGYQLERALHEAKRSEYVAKFRALAPLDDPATIPPGASEAIAANNVVHGERILAKWQDPNDSDFNQLRAAAAQDFVAIDAIFTKLAADVDGLGDLLIAHSVHQVAEGNFNRAGLSLDGVLHGEPLPDFAVARAPRTGTTISHRVVTWLANSSTPPPGWPTNAHQVRAVADPAVNAWAAEQLPDPATVTCTVTDASGTQKTVALVELELSALDAIFASELELRARIAALSGVGPASTIDFNDAEVISFGTLLTMTGALRALLVRARPLTGADLELADDGPAHGVDFNDLSGRVTAIRAQLAALLTRVEANDADALIAAAHFGFPDAVPQPGRAAQQLRAVEAGIAARIANVDQIDQRQAGSPAPSLDAELEKLGALVGSGFVAAPRFTAANSDELAASFANSDRLLRNRRLEAAAWFTRASLAREGMSVAADVVRFTEAVCMRPPAFTVGQIPFSPNDSWIALPQEPDAPRKGRVSLFALGTLPAFDKPMAGLILDEWNEVLPAGEESTALAFHFDRPNARAPHAILLAVAPDVTKPWSLDLFEKVLVETLDLAKARLVDQDAMTELDQYLPAMTFSMNADNEAISTDLRSR